MKIGDIIRRKGLDSQSPGGLAVVIDIKEAGPKKDRYLYPEIMWLGTGEIVHLMPARYHQLYEVVDESR